MSLYLLEWDDQEDGNHNERILVTAKNEEDARDTAYMHGARLIITNEGKSFEKREVFNDNTHWKTWDNVTCELIGFAEESRVLSKFI